MKNLLLCWKSQQKKSSKVKTFHVSSTMRLETFGRLSPDRRLPPDRRIPPDKMLPPCRNNQLKHKQKRSNTSLTRPRTPEIPELPGQVLSYPDLYENNSKTYLNKKDSFRSQPSVMSINIPEYENNDPRKEIGIQAGSPLGNVNGGKHKTETTLSITTHKQFWKNPWKVPKPCDSLEPIQAKKELSPIKKPLVKIGKPMESMLPAVDISVTNKLPPVDKSFLLKLERENSQKQDTLKKQKNKTTEKTMDKTKKVNKTEKKKHKTDNTYKQNKLLHESVENLLKDIDSEIPKTPAINHEIEAISETDSILKAKALPLTISEKTSDITVTNNEDPLLEIYDSDELELMDCIANEFVE